jgi:hypothetical protein
VSPSTEAGGGVQEGRTREIETKGGGVEAADDDGEIDDDGLEEEDTSSVLRVGDEAVTRSKVAVEEAACSEAEVEAAAVASTVGGGV